MTIGLRRLSIWRAIKAKTLKKLPKHKLVQWPKTWISYSSTTTKKAKKTFRQQLILQKSLAPQS